MSIPALYGPVAAAAALLAAGGAAKLARPNTTANVLDKLGVPVATAVVRVGAAAELVIAAFALAYGTRAIVLLVAASYAAFAAFVVVAKVRRLPISSCGCFGEVDAPPTFTHAAVNIVAAGCAFSVAMTGGTAPSLVSVCRELAWRSLPLFAFVALASYAAFLVMSVLPRTLETAKGKR